MIKIVMDAQGGDYAPQEVVKAAVLAAKKHSDLQIILTGKQDEIKNVLTGLKYNENQIVIVNCTQVIENNESPTEAFKTKTDSSLVRAFEILKGDSEVVGLISAGSTGALLTGAFMKIGRIPGVSRPTLAPLLPTENGGKVTIVDCGANVDCKPINLVHFAIMGSVYMQEAYGIKNPRIALLNVGAEEHKGNELTKLTYEEIKKLPINFAGNMEARDLLSGDYNVVVADGFDGNILLKSVEGMMNFAMRQFKEAIYSSFLSKIGGRLMKKSILKMKDKFDYNTYGGSPLLGVKKLVMKTHGTAKELAFSVCVDQIIQMHKNELITKVGKAVEKAVITE